MARRIINTSDYSSTLEEVHQAMRAKMQRNTLKKNAAILQQILSDIKKTAKIMSEGAKDPISQELVEQYGELINEAFQTQKEFHNSQFLPTTIFRRMHGYSSLKSGADDIFEEDLASILASAAKMSGNMDLGNIELYLIGGKTAKSKAINFDKMTKEIEKQNVDIVNRMAEKSGKRISENGIKQIKATVHKTDVIGYPATITATLEVNINIALLIELMKDATFSAKNYKSVSYKDGQSTIKDFEEIGLHLGNSNLYKAVLGALTEIQMSDDARKKFFYEGANIYLNGDSRASSVEKHFSDLRFIYELRGSGLLGDAGLLPVKYLIYNDPTSDAIFVKDTATIILESFDNSRSLFGGIQIPASRIRS